MVAEAKSGMDMAMTVVPKALFAAEMKKPPLMPGGYITISKKKLLQNLEINGGTRINAWVESMRASSPTSHRKSDVSLSQELTSWMVSTYLTTYRVPRLIFKFEFEMKTRSENACVNESGSTSFCLERVRRNY